MGFIDNIFNRKNEIKCDNRSYDNDFQNPILGTLSISNYSSFTTKKSLKLSTVYRCVNLISDSIASLPLIPYTYRKNWKYINYDNGLYNLLNVQPNSIISAFTFKKMIITSMLLKGNAFILQDKDKEGTIKSFTLLNSDLIEPNINSNGDLEYKVTNSDVIYDRTQIIHILNYTNNGINGLSVLEHASQTLGIAYDSEEHSGNFFRNGANLLGLLKPKEGVTLRKDAAIRAKEEFINSLSTGVIGGKSGGIVVLDSGLEYQAISVNPKDSQLLESRQYNVIDICRFFNVPPSLAFSDNGKYSTSEQQQLDYINNTLLPIIEKIENEFFRKVYLKTEWDNNELKFDVENLLRLDATTKADYLTKMFQIGAFTPNEVRSRINSEFPVEGGNRAFIQVNVQPVDNLISEQKVVSDTSKQIDNKLKNKDTDNEE
jgi:HK97 family phage portal protein